MAVDFWPEDNPGQPVLQGTNDITAQEPDPLAEATPEDSSQPAVDGQGEGGTISAATPSPDPALPEHMTPEQAYGSMKHFQTKYNEQNDRLADLEKKAAMADILLAQQQQSQTLDDKQAPKVSVRPTVPSMPKETYGEEWDTYVAQMHQYQQDFDKYQDSRLDEKLKVIEDREKVLEQQRAVNELKDKTFREAHYEVGLDENLSRELSEKLSSGELARDGNLVRILSLGFREFTKANAPASAAALHAKALREREQHRLPPTAASEPSAAIDVDTDDLTNPSRRVTPIKMY